MRIFPAYSQTYNSFVEQFYVTKKNKDYFYVHLELDSSLYEIKDGRKNILYKQFKAGPFKSVNPKQLIIENKLRVPWLFSESTDSYNTIRTYIGKQDTTMFGFTVRGFVFKEETLIGNDYIYGISCYDTKYLIPIFYFSFSDSTLTNCYSIRINSNKVIKATDKLIEKREGNKNMENPFLK